MTTINAVNNVIKLARASVNSLVINNDYDSQYHMCSALIEIMANYSCVASVKDAIEILNAELTMSFYELYPTLTYEYIEAKVKRSISDLVLPAEQICLTGAINYVKIVQLSRQPQAINTTLN